ncbi:hypothetical protein PAXRUDRAFT_15374 [Paxillus rubicundulus Ve08.2h10]|uniref:Uncharacterized protein n=1 Tax=Paxillus rubicundulus Ve08.2h10 TaxID=930991 RepID=A0A0D0DPY6_9AGAM|nr:hypothetical protein PAXRUDRAFT_15374 [Paxillus rubicundulus Ve08.2h10]
MADPSLEVCPNFAGDAFAPIHEAWADEEAERERREQEEEETCLVEEELEHERREGEKMNDFDEATSISSVIVPCPSQYTLQKLSSFDHVDLWYFSPAGCTEASKYNRSNVDETLGISKVDDILTLCLVAAVKASRNSLEDHDLPFEVFLQAKNNLLFYAKKASWPAKHLDTLAEFFWNIETHPMRSNPNGNSTVLTYASRVRHSWHDDLKANRASNISIINEELMKNISWEINAKVSEDCAQKASFPLNTSLTHPTNLFLSSYFAPLCTHHGGLAHLLHRASFHYHGTLAHPTHPRHICPTNECVSSSVSTLTPSALWVIPGTFAIHRLPPTAGVTVRHLRLSIYTLLPGLLYCLHAA